MPTTEDAIIARWLADHGHPELAWERGPGYAGGEWFEGEPFDFTQPAPLLAAVEAYCESTDTLDHPVSYQTGRYSRVTEVRRDKRYWAMFGPESIRIRESQEHALRAALAAAIAAEGGN